MILLFQAVIEWTFINSLLACFWRMVLTKIFLKRLDEIQPSQLFISSEKLSQVMERFNPPVPESIEPVPIKELDGQVIFTDGHTRALAAYQIGLTEVRVIWEEDDLDWEEYSICVGWCKTEGITTIAHLKDRIVPQAEYEAVWYKRCEEMQKALEEKRAIKRLREKDHEGG